MGGQTARRRQQTVEHAAVQGVLLLGPVQLDVSDVVFDFDADAIGHSVSPGDAALPCRKGLDREVYIIYLIVYRAPGPRIEESMTANPGKTRSRTPGRRAETRVRGSLSRDEILDAGLRIAREGDLRSLTMQRLGDELGVTPMAVYRYFQNKDEIVDGVLDRFVEASTVTSHADPTDSWQEWLRVTFAGMRTSILSTPGVLPLLGTSSSMGHGAMSVLNEVLEVLRGAGFSRESAAEAFFTLMGFTLGAVAQNREAAVYMGIQPERVYLITMGISAALAAVAGVFIAPILEAVPTMWVFPLFKGFAVVIIGGPRKHRRRHYCRHAAGIFRNPRQRAHFRKLSGHGVSGGDYSSFGLAPQRFVGQEVALIEGYQRGL